MVKIAYCLLVLIGLAGLFSVLFWTFKNECLTIAGMFSVYLLACLSMLFLFMGVRGFSKIREERA